MINYLQQSHCNTNGDTGTPKGTLIIGNGPGISLKLLQDTSQLELDLLNREEEPCRAISLWRHGLPWAGCRTVLSVETQHLLDLLRTVLLSSSENVGFRTSVISKFVHLCL